MFPDTANFTDPGYTAMPWDSEGQTYPEGPPDLSIPNLPSGLPSSAPPIGQFPQGPSAPVSAQPGSSLLGWLGLANNIAQTAVTAARGGTPTTKRPGTLTQSVSGTAGITLGVIAVVFVLVVLALRKA